ncbi:MAG TPA: hypothetical protein VK427_07090 [Kofleriaceae bacterium]|nr:hypothetical protein [Kofleriaceae bacterium]
MTDSINHRQLAKELDRRRTRRRVTGFLGAIAAAIGAFLYLRCGSGWGTGGQGAGDGGTGAAVVPGDAGPARCSLRLAASGLTVDGKAATRDEAIAACKRTTGADVLITGDARQGDWDELRAALEAAGIPLFTREPRGVTPDAGA